MPKIKKSLKGKKHLPRAAAPSGGAKVKPADMGRSATRLDTGGDDSYEPPQKRQHLELGSGSDTDTLFVESFDDPADDDEEMAAPTPFTINMDELDLRLMQLNADEGDEGDEVEFDDQAMPALQEMQDVADYQDRGASSGDQNQDPTQEDEDGDVDIDDDIVSRRPAVVNEPGFSNASQPLQHMRLRSTIFDTEMAVGIWAQTIGLSRPEYQTLLSILRTAEPDDLRSLPTTLDTLKRRTKGALPLLEIRMESTSLLEPQRMPSRPAGRKDTDEGTPVETLYFFNPQTFFQAYLSTPDIVNKMYFGLGLFVDSPAELWETNMWHSTIRISSGEFAVYPGVAQSASQETAPAITEVTRYAQEHTGQPGGPIFPSDFVRFACRDTSCECRRQGGDLRHLGVVLAVAKDMRTSTGKTGAVTLRVRRMASAAQLSELWQEGDDLIENMTPEPITGKEVFLLGDDIHVHYVLPADVEPIDFELYAYYDFEGAVAEGEPPLPDQPSSDSFQMLLRRIAYTNGNNLPEVRPIWKQHPIRGELEIEHFGRQTLVDKFFRSPENGMRVMVVPMINFTDDFGLYRNMYRALMGFYIINAAFTILERRRRTNIFPLTIGPHGSNIEGVIDAIGSFLVQLDAGMVMTINGQDTLVCAMLAYFIADMPQQQENSGFLSQRSTFGCRLCQVDKKFWKSLELDLVSDGRYHWEIVRLRKRMATMSTKAEKLRFTGAKSGVGNARSMEVTPVPAMQRIAPALDVNFTKPPEPCHSNLGGLTKMAAQLLVENILTKPASLEFARVLRSFPFPPDCPHLPSPIRHLGSYTLTQLGRYSIILPVLLRCWLKAKHVNAHFMNALPLVMGRQLQAISRLLGVANPEILYVHMITVCFARIGAANRILLANFLTTAQRATMEAELRLGSEMFQLLNETAAQASIKNPYSRANSVVPSRASTPVPVADNSAAAIREAARGGRGRGRARARARAAIRSTSRGRASTSRGSSAVNTPAEDRELSDDDAEFEAERLRETMGTKTSTTLRKHNERPNLHTAQHYPEMIAEYGLGINLTVLTGEEMHRIFKEMIYKTNHRNPERDLLQRINFEMTVRFLLLGSMSETEQPLIDQLQRINKKCPGLFDTLLPVSERTIIQRSVLGDGEGEPEIEEYTATLMDDPLHQNVKARAKLGVKFARNKLRLPAYGREAENSLLASVKTAFSRDYNRPNVDVLRDVKFQWWKTISFDDPNDERRMTVHRGDFMYFADDSSQPDNSNLSSAPGQIEQILTLDMGTNKTYCFLLIRPSTRYIVDQVTSLPTFKIGSHTSMIGLPVLRGKKQWMVPVTAESSGQFTIEKADKLTPGQMLLHVDWISKVSLLF